MSESSDQASASVGEMSRSVRIAEIASCGLDKLRNNVIRLFAIGWSGDQLQCLIWCEKRTDKIGRIFSEHVLIVL